MPVNGDYWHMSRTPAVIGQQPAVGEHNEEVLSEILGYSSERISVIQSTPKNQVHMGGWA